MMRFLVTSRYQIRDVAMPQPYAVISITDPLSPPVVLRDDPMRLGMLRVEFYDLDRASGPFDKLFHASHADTILRFAEQFAGRDIVMVCQCEAGISRSAAVAAALSRIYNEQDASYFTMFHPNRRVYALLLAQHYKAPDARPLAFSLTQPAIQPLTDLPLRETIQPKGDHAS